MLWARSSRVRKGPETAWGRSSGRLAVPCRVLTSGEGGIRTLGRLASTPVFETYPLPHDDTAKQGISATAAAHPSTRICRRIRLSFIWRGTRQQLRYHSSLDHTMH